MEPNTTSGITKIAEDIIAGKMTMCQIKMHNANRIMEWVRSGGHDAETCSRQHCIHAARDEDIAHAATLASEAMNECTCGQHQG